MSEEKTIIKQLNQDEIRDFILKKDYEIFKYKQVIDKIKEKVNQYEFISGYYDNNYDGEDKTYSHDTLKEELLELLEEIE